MPEVRPIQIPHLDKLDAAIAHIEANPAEWSQLRWFERCACGTTCCLAGTIALLDGWSPIDWYPTYDGVTETTARVRKGDVESYVDRAAMKILGIEPAPELGDEPSAEEVWFDRLFEASRTLDDIKRMRADLDVNGEDPR